MGDAAVGGASPGDSPGETPPDAKDVAPQIPSTGDPIQNYTPDEDCKATDVEDTSGGNVNDLTPGVDSGDGGPDAANNEETAQVGLGTNEVVSESGTMSDTLAKEGTDGTGGADEHRTGEGASALDRGDSHSRVGEFALAAINAAREDKQLEHLSLDTALVVPATTHARTMCEHDFLSHWDIEGRKPYQRYSDFAYGQHITEEVFGFDVDEGTEDEVLRKIKECVEERARVGVVDECANTNHLLERLHTHVGLGVYQDESKFRYVEVYADRYLELLEAPLELSVANAGSGFRISVQMISPDVGPYACLVFHDPVSTPLTIGELQQQFTGPYSDFTPSQVGIVWPWQMELLQDGVIEIPVPASTIEPGTYYLQILVHEDPESIPYDAEPGGGLPLPGDSFCGGSLVLRAPEETAGDIGISDLCGEDGLTFDNEYATLEEKEARTMASSTALRRDFAPIVKIKVVQELGGLLQRDDNYERASFIPQEMVEDMAQPILGLHFLRLGCWDDTSSRGQSEFTGTTGNASVAVEEGRAADEAEEPTGGEATSAPPSEMPTSNADADDAVTDVPTEEGAGAEEIIVQGDRVSEGESGVEREGPNESIIEGGDQSDGEGRAQAKTEATPAPDAPEQSLPLVITDIVVATFRQDEQVEAPHGFDMIPGDLANASFTREGGGLEGADEGQGETEAVDRKATDAATQENSNQGEEDCTNSRDSAFLCVKMLPYTDMVSPVTDLALVYGNEGFKMGFGFNTVELPQVVNDMYGSVLHLCYKKAGASLAVIQQVAEKTAEKTAKQIQQHLGIDAEDADGRDTLVEDEAYDVDTNMTPEEMLAWEEKRNLEAAERANKREQAEKDRRRKEASEALQRRIEEALKEKEDLVKQNGEWQKKIASLMLSQQKTREEARTEHGGRGVEKEATPVHESEKHYAESLMSIVSCRQKLQEQQAEYDSVAIALQTRLDEKEYKSREIADSFREFKREIARTAEHSRTGKAIPKRVISQFEAAEAKKDEDIEKVRLKNINLRMMLRKVEGKLRSKEQLAEGLHLIDFEQLKIENQTVNEKIEERNEELLKLRKKNTTTVQILTHTKEKLQFIAAENAVTSHQLFGLEEELNQERDCLTRAKKDKDSLRSEVASLRQSQGFANSDLLILDFEQRKAYSKKLSQKLDEMQSKHHLLLMEQARLQETNSEEYMSEMGATHA